MASNLLDLGVLSRDSIWLMEKDPRGGSVTYPLSELDQAQIDEVERQGKGLERGYLQGRFGAQACRRAPRRLASTGGSRDVHAPPRRPYLAG